VDENLLSHDPVLWFDGFRLDRRDGLFRKLDNGRWEPVVLGSRALDVLRALVEGRGALVSKQALMDAAWPGMAVEDSNLTVQISALRRVLDDGRATGSGILTVIGRGYRFLPDVTAEPPAFPADTMEPYAEPAEAPPIGSQPMAESIDRAGSSRRSRLLVWLAALLLVSVLGFGGAIAWRFWGSNQTLPITAPRLSIVVLPFQNLSGDPNEDYLADGMTDDLTTGLSNIPEAFVIANASARTYKGKAVDARQVGRELGVRYVVEGSTRRAGAVLRVNVQLISTETGAHVWSDRVDEPIADLAAGQDAILARMRGTLGVSLIEIEIARGRRAPPSTPDAFDLILRARSLRNQPENRQRFEEALSLYDQALRLDPSSVLALTGAAAMLIQSRNSWNGWFNAEDQERVKTLVARAREIAPASEEVLGVYAAWLSVETDCRQSMPAARRMIETYPNPWFGYGLLSNCLIITGRSEEAIPLMEKVIRLNPRSAGLANRFNFIGSAHLFLGRNEQAIAWLERALAVDPERRDDFGGGTKRKLAAAYAHAGKDAEARRALAAADKDWPFDTVRGHFPDDINPAFAAQVRNYQEGLRRAGGRDHAEEDADFGVPGYAILRSDLVGYTPAITPGAPTIRTTELPRFIAERKPVIIDPLTYFWGQSIPGAVGLKNAGIGGTLSDRAQERLGRKMVELTGGDLSKPIVAVGWNSERFDGYNLALRLVALGYTNVHWYRGGREAWEAAGLPETELTPQDW